MRRVLAASLWLLTLAIPACGLSVAQSPFALAAGLRECVRSGQVDATTAISVLAYVTVAVWAALVYTVVRMVVDNMRQGHQIEAPRFTGVLAGALLLLLAQNDSPSSTSHVEPVSIPVTSVLAPTLASGLLADLLSRRRTQRSTLALGIEPDVLTDAEYEELSRLTGELAGEQAPMQGEGDHVGSAPDRLVEVIQRTRPIDQVPLDDEVIHEHQIVVRTFGYPVIENVSGQRAIFRKTRSLELLTWLVLNRDRMRRSAARTAMWEGVVSDSSFATIVSDARRGLSELCPGTDPKEWMRPTFSDEIPLSPLVVSDVDLLRSALSKFRQQPEPFRELVVHHLDSVRDLPFAGTSFRWPDLDGTTTRIVMLVLTAVNDVVEHCLDVDDRHTAVRALTAGLRMMPGHEVLLRLQKKLCLAEPTRVETFL